jgi:hypothetical protein
MVTAAGGRRHLARRLVESPNFGAQSVVRDALGGHITPV